VHVQRWPEVGGAEGITCVGVYFRNILIRKEHDTGISAHVTELTDITPLSRLTDWYGCRHYQHILALVTKSAGRSIGELLA
jgi:hypothetical protein